MAWRIGETLDLFEQFEWIREAGFDGIGFHTSPGVPGKWQGLAPEAAGLSLRERLRDLVEQFSFCEVHAPFELTLTGESLEATTEGLLPVLDLAGDIGAAVVTVHAELPGPEEPTAPWRSSMEQLDARAESNNTVIGLELVEGFDWVRQLELPNIGLTLDIGHMYLDGSRPLQPFGSIAQVVRECADLLFHLHVHDYNGTYDHVELGTGHVDLKGCLAALKEVGYSRTLCLELNPDLVSPEGMQRSLDWMREQICGLASPGNS